MIVKLTFDCEAFLDGPDVGEEVLELVPARLPGNVAHLECAPLAGIGG